MISCAPQSQHQRRSSCQRGDSPIARPVVRVRTPGVKFRREYITISLAKGYGDFVHDATRLRPILLQVASKSQGTAIVVAFQRPSSARLLCSATLRPRQTWTRAMVFTTDRV